MFDDVTSVALRSALTGLSTRQRTIADNVANINTPRFLAGRVEFEDALRSAVAEGETRRVAPSVSRSLDAPREDGNNVNLDQETLNGIETNLRYQLALRAVDDRGKLTKIALGVA